MRLFRGRQNAREIEDDIASFLAEKTESLMDQGVTREEAEAQARREFGNVSLIAEESRDVWSWRFVERVASDIRFALRSYLRSRAFAITVVLTLALGIGVNAGIFNLLHTVLFQTLPVPEPEQLRTVSITGTGDSDTEPIFSYPVLRDMQRSVNITGMSSTGDAECILPNSIHEQVHIQLVDGRFFEVLRLRPIVGTVLNKSDDVATGAFRAVISGGYWRERFGSDPNIVGRSVLINGTRITIAGVLPPSFFGVQPEERVDYWLPVSAQQAVAYMHDFWNSNGQSSAPFMRQREIRWLHLIARVRTSQAASAALAAINHIYALDMQREANGWPDTNQRKQLLSSRCAFFNFAKGGDNLHFRFAAPLSVLMGAAALVLLIACFNLASLSWARYAARAKEFAIRCSIGASYARVFQQVTTEALLLSALAAIIAIPCAIATDHVLVAWASGSSPLQLDLSIHPELLFFIAATTLCAGLLCGIVPALQSVRAPIQNALKQYSATIAGTRLPLGNLLIAAQVVFSFVLLIGALLFVRTLVNYRHVPVGFNPEHLLSIQVDTRSAHFKDADLVKIYHSILQEITSVPGVRSAALAECALSSDCRDVAGVRIEGGSYTDSRMQQNTVSADYLQTVGLTLLAGRNFTSHDTSAHPVPAIISATATRRYFHGAAPLGRYFGYGGDSERYQIVGVVADARINNVHDAPEPVAYYPVDAQPDYMRSIEVHTAGDPRAVENDVRKALASAAPTLPIQRMRLASEQLDLNLNRETLLARLASAFAVLALALACLGVYGVLSYAVNRRRSELGVRLALGAEPRQLRGMVLRQALLLVAIGVGIGAAFAFPLAQGIKGLLFGVSASNPAVFGLSATALLAAGTIAAFIPAQRASQIDPNQALRDE